MRYEKFLRARARVVEGRQSVTAKTRSFYGWRHESRFSRKERTDTEIIGELLSSEKARYIDILQQLHQQIDHN